MDQPEYILEPGTRIRTHVKLGETTGFLIAERHLSARKREALGLIVDPVPGHGGDVYFVRHAEGDSGNDPCPVASYCFTEFELAL